MMKGRVAPSIMPTMVQVAKQITKVPQMTSPQKKELKKQRQKVKREHDARFLEGEKHLHLDEDIYEDQFETTRNL